MNIFYKTILCFVLWGLICVNFSFAGEDSHRFKTEYLGPRLNLSIKSLQKAMETFSQARIDEALRKTADNIDEIGKRNFKRNPSGRELVVALAMILEGKTLKKVDYYFDSLNYMVEELGVREKPRQILRLRIFKIASTMFLCLSLGAGFVFMDIIKELYSLSTLITAPVFLIAGWFFIGRSIDFFFWIENKIDPKNRHIFSNPIQELEVQEKEQYLSEIKKTLRNVINDSFDEPEPLAKKENVYQPKKKQYRQFHLNIDEAMGRNNFICPLEIGLPGLVLSSI